MRRHELYKRGRGCPITCLSFGKNRKAEYPDYLFFHGCDILEDAVENGAKRANRQEKKYECTAGHSDLAHPTTLKRQYRPKNVAAPACTTKQEQAKTEGDLNPATVALQRRDYEDHLFSVENKGGEEDSPQLPRTTISCVTPASSADSIERSFVVGSTEKGFLME
jgi:hypothetical protein